MKAGPVFNFLGALLAFLGAFMLLSAAWAIYYREEELVHFVLSAAITSGIGYLLWKFNDPEPGIGVREGFAIVSLGWATVAVFGALPFLITGAIPSVTDAIFESTSGFTTTGASILTDVEALPKSVLFWRSLTHWLGGMGIIVLALAILPILGIGGMQLYKAEVPGPTKDKLTPRIQQTAKLLWGVYALISVTETALLLLAKMDLFDAICHTFGTVATGGFSTRNASIAAFDNPWVHWIIMVFMVLSATNFTLHYYALKGKPLHYLRDAQFRYFIGALIIGVMLVTLSSLSSIKEQGHSMRDVIFEVVSQSTCTGFATVDYELWHPAAITVIILLMFMGGMVGSTAGGLKTLRWVVVFKQIIIEIRQLIHPNAVYALRLGEQVISEKVATNILSFCLLFITAYIVSALALLLLGLDHATALGGPIACLSNVGPGLGLIGPVENYGFLPAPAKWVLMADMIGGRLEISTILVLFSRSFWRR